MIKYQLVYCECHWLRLSRCGSWHAAKAANRTLLWRCFLSPANRKTLAWNGLAGVAKPHICTFSILIKCHLFQNPDCINKGLGFEFLEKECLHLINREDNNPHRQKCCERAKIAGINRWFNCCFHYFTSQVDMQDFKSDFYLPQFKFLPFFSFDWQKVYCPLKLISINIFILKSFFFSRLFLYWRQCQTYCD